MAARAPAWPAMRGIPISHAPSKTPPATRQRSGPRRRANGGAPKHGTRPAANDRAPRPPRSMRFRDTARRSPETPTRAPFRWLTAAGRPSRRCRPTTDDLGRSPFQDHVDAVPAKPGPLVEAGARRSRLGDDTSTGARIPGAATDPRAAEAAPARGRRGRRSAQRAQEQDRVLRAARGPGHDRASDGGTPNLRSERNPIEGLQPQRAPPPTASARPSARSANRARGTAAATTAARNARAGTTSWARSGERWRSRHPRRGSRAADAARGARAAGSGTTSSRSSSMVAGPIRLSGGAPRHTGKRLRRAVVEDLLSCDGTHAGEGVQLPERRCAQADGPAATLVPGAAADAPATFRRHEHLLPAASGAARFRASTSAFGVAAPALSIASATRDPSANRQSPGRRTAPATSTRALLTAGPARRPQVQRQAPTSPLSGRASVAEQKHDSQPQDDGIACRRVTGNHDTLSIMPTIVLRVRVFSEPD